MPKRTPAVKAVARLQPTVRAKGEPFLDLFGKDNQLNVYAGELEVRPPGAPTTGAGEARRLPVTNLLQLLIGRRAVETRTHSRG